MEAFMEVTSTEAFIGASMEYVEDKKAPTHVTSTGAHTKASTKVPWK